MYYKSAVTSRIGKVRYNNQDNYLFCKKRIRSIDQDNTEIFLYKTNGSDSLLEMIFDGMGGENFGEKASFIAATEFKNNINSLISELEENVNRKEVIKKYSNIVNRKLVDINKKDNLGTSGTTLAGVFIKGNEALSFNIGDSSVLLFRDEKLTKISKDHVQNFKRDDNSYKGALVQYIGIDLEDFYLTPYVEEFKIQSGDKIIICSDGITNMLNNEDIVNIVSRKKPLEGLVEELINESLKKGGSDNMTINLIEVREDVLVKQNKKNIFIRYTRSIIIFIIIILSLIICYIKLKDLLFL